MITLVPVKYSENILFAFFYLTEVFVIGYIDRFVRWDASPAALSLIISLVLFALDLSNGIGLSQDIASE